MPKIAKLTYDKDPTAVCTRGQKVTKRPMATPSGQPITLFIAALNCQERRNYRRKVA